MKITLKSVCVVSAIWFAASVVGCESPSRESAALRTTGLETPVRHIQLEGEPNFRDLGGYKTTDGRTVKWREVFRTGELGRLSDADVKKLDELNLKRVVNFLLPPEIEKHGPDRLPSGVELVLDPITGERSAELSMVAQRAISTGDFEGLPRRNQPRDSCDPDGRGEGAIRTAAEGCCGSGETPPLALPLLAWRTSHRHGSGHPPQCSRRAVGDRPRRLYVDQ